MVGECGEGRLVVFFFGLLIDWRWEGRGASTTAHFVVVTDWRWEGGGASRLGDHVSRTITTHSTGPL